MYEFTGSFEPYVEIVPYSLYESFGLKRPGGWVGYRTTIVPYRPPDRRLPIVGRRRPGTSALDTLSARGVCRGFGRFAPRGEHWARFC